MQNQPGLLFVVQQKKMGAVGIVCAAVFLLFAVFFSIAETPVMILVFLPFVLLGVWVIVWCYVWKLWVYSDRFVLRSALGKIKTVYFSELTSARTEPMRGGFSVFANGRRAFDINTTASNYSRVHELLAQLSDNAPVAATNLAAPPPPGARYAVTEYMFNSNRRTTETVLAKPGWAWSLFLLMTLALPILMIPELPQADLMMKIMWFAFVLLSVWLIGYSFLRKITIDRDDVVRYRLSLWVSKRCYLNDFSEIRLLSAQNQTNQTFYNIDFYKNGTRVFRVASHYRGFSDLLLRLQSGGWV